MAENKTQTITESPMTLLAIHSLAKYNFLHSLPK